jgi:hypothetical protein
MSNSYPAHMVSKSKPVRALGAVAAVSVVLAAGLPQLTPEKFDWIGAAVGLLGLCATAAVTYYTQTQVTPAEDVLAKMTPAGKEVAGPALYGVPNGTAVTITETATGQTAGQFFPSERMEGDPL